MACRWRNDALCLRVNLWRKQGFKEKRKKEDSGWPWGLVTEDSAEPAGGESLIEERRKKKSAKAWKTWLHRNISCPLAPPSPRFCNYFFSTGLTPREDCSNGRTYRQEKIFFAPSFFYNYDNIVLVETNYYRIELRSMSGKKDSSGNWTVEAELVMTNIWTDRYLDYDPQKVATEDIEYLPWIYPGDTRSMTVTFTGTGDDPESVTGSFSKSIDGYQIELELFKSVFGATLRLSKTDPVVSASVN